MRPSIVTTRGSTAREQVFGPRGRDWEWPFIEALAAFNFLFAAWLIVKPGGDEALKWFDDITLVVAPSLAACMAAIVAARNWRTRSGYAWALISFGLFMIASGEVAATAYNSMESQTDSTPWITASGTRCREGVIASNFLPIGTKVLIEGFGERVFTVEDRMNKRYKKRIDIWFRDYDDAMQFGLRKIRFHVIKTA